MCLHFIKGFIVFQDIMKKDLMQICDL